MQIEPDRDTSRYIHIYNRCSLEGMTGWAFTVSLHNPRGPVWRKLSTPELDLSTCTEKTIISVVIMEFKFIF